MVLLYWGFNFLKGEQVFEKKNVLYAVYDKVEGLTAAKPVLINGYKVGMIDDVYFHPDGSGRLMVAMNITTDFVIARNTKATIVSTDLLGEKAINLDLGTSPEPAVSGDTLISDIELSLTEEVNKQVAPLKEKVESLFGSVDTVLILISGFLDDNAQNNFGATFSSLRRSVTRLESTLTQLDKTVNNSKGDIQGTFANLHKITTNLEQNGEQLSGIFNNLNAITDSLSKARLKETFASLNEALAAAESVLKKVDTGDGTMGKLINDPELYENLERASEQLDLLLLDIKYNPKRYVDLSLFGGRKEYNEEENLKKEQEAAAKRDELRDQSNK